MMKEQIISRTGKGHGTFCPTVHLRRSDRYMRRKMNDMITTFRKVRHPIGFVTMTRNPAWPENAATLLQNQKIENRSERFATYFT